MTVQPLRARRPWMPVATLLASLAVAAALVGNVGQASAQDEMAVHPAHIHTGTCDELGDVVFPLTNVSEMGMMEGMMGGTPEAGAAAMETGEPMGAETAVMVETSATMVEAPLQDIVEGGHAINVHQSEENIEEYIACGDIGGMLMGPMEMGDRTMGEMLVVGLQELNGSGYAGVATLEAMDEETLVTVYLAEGLSDGTDASS